MIILYGICHFHMLSILSLYIHLMLLWDFYSIHYIYTSIDIVTSESQKEYLILSIQEHPELWNI